MRADEAGLTHIWVGMGEVKGLMGAPPKRGETNAGKRSQGSDILPALTTGLRCE